ncbi:hypothetical protein CPB83DRAFT_852763 [Crepidotus variabilis]|uniref:Uncharacterized protein n=1 Tax=Crepidotus variabilis TaxID=179855 RepID=A0A9P6JRE6_9AGAR|nr:hypothetical protein CPB83DRAFT_852763 [Crepidotus variabilis]
MTRAFLLWLRNMKTTNPPLTVPLQTLCQILKLIPTSPHLRPQPQPQYRLHPTYWSISSTPNPTNQGLFVSKE